MTNDFQKVKEASSLICKTNIPEGSATFYSLFWIMKFGKNTVLALALATVNTNLFAQACDGHDPNHNHRHLENDLCDEDPPPNGLSTEIDGRRTQSHFRVGNYSWGTLEAFEAAGARCVSSDPSPRQVRNSDDILDAYRRRFGGSNRRLATAKQIPVYFHVIKPNYGRGGTVSNTQIREQMAVLNASFKSITASQGDFVFTYMGTNTTESNSFYSASHGTSAERQMKSSLRQGGANALNIYTNEPYVSNEAQAHRVCVPTFIPVLTQSLLLLFVYSSNTEVAEYWAGPRSQIALRVLPEGSTPTMALCFVSIPCLAVTYSRTTEETRQSTKSDIG
jgi:hypothetical protein